MIRKGLDDVSKFQATLREEGGTLMVTSDKTNI